MSDYAYPETLVETQWLVEHLEDPKVRIVEMDLDPKAYNKEHILGSIFWSGFAPLLPDMQINFDPDAISKLLSESGIDRDTTVVAIHRDFTAISGFVFWLLKVFGHRDVRILNGGCRKWQQENLPLTNNVTTVVPTKYKLPTVDNSLRISTSEVRQHSDRPNTILLDVRTPQEYQGEIYLRKPPQQNERAGHIPGAVNIYYELAHNKDTTFKSAKELRQLYNIGVGDDKLIIPYCAVGARSAHTWFILKYLLGCSQVKNYDGSWNVWSKMPDTPVAK